MRNVSEIRKSHNKELLQRMRAGESLCSMDSADSWYPPRPIVAKDPLEIRRLYGENVAPLGVANPPARKKLEKKSPSQRPSG